MRPTHHLFCSAPVKRRAATVALMWLASSQMAATQSLTEMAGLDARPVLTLSGSPGIIDMPSAFMSPDGDLSFSVSTFSGITRSSINFQFFPRLSGSFRYTEIANYRSADNGILPENYYDRSFDLRYQLLREGPLRPAVTLGLIDFGGTGLLSSEYLVASKHIGSTFTATGGLGFGRLATEGGFENPLTSLNDRFGSRPNNAGADRTGQANFNRLFRGDAAFFGGVTWAATPKLTLMAEYSSDAYPGEVKRKILDEGTPYNFGATYKVTPSVDLAAYALRGDNFGLRFSYSINPNVPRQANGIGPAPDPILVRGTSNSLPVMPATTMARSALQNRLQAALAADGLTLEAFDMTATGARVRLRNTQFNRPAQAVGRTARALTRLMPTNIENFTIELSENGLPVSATTLRRSVLEAAEFDPFAIEKTYQSARVATPADVSPASPFIQPSAFTYDIGSYFNRSLFDPRKPLLFDTGLRVNVAYEARPGLIFSARVEQPVFSNRDSTDRVSDSVLPKVRSESDNYHQTKDLRLPYATAAYFFRPSRATYGRVTAGLLEKAFAGVSAELLWKPDDHRLAYGVELNAVQQRQPGTLTDMGSGTYDNSAITGHVSAYYDIESGYFAQVDVGRYLAGDTGATFTLSRDFDNGVRVGAFATLTDVSFDDFGEGAFDKGIFINLPTDWLTGRPSRSSGNLTLRPILRDGGARVYVQDRLYELVRDSDAQAINASWGQVLR